MPLFRKTDRRQVLELPISSIQPNPAQPRRHFEEEGLAQLADSISQLGILQPLTVRRVPSGWELVAGERRLRAAARAGLDTVPCLEVLADSSASSLLALVENLQRRDLDFLEEARALRRLMDVYGLSQEAVAAKVSLSQPAVANKLRLLRLPGDILEQLREAGLTERHARALLSLPTEDLQRQAAAHIIRHRLTVARAEEYIARLSRPKGQGCTPIYRTRDVRLFLNTIQKSLSIMNAAGIAAHCGREETEEELLLTIHIPKQHTLSPLP